MDYSIVVHVTGPPTADHRIHSTIGFMVVDFVSVLRTMWELVMAQYAPGVHSLRQLIDTLVVPWGN